MNISLRYFPRSHKRPPRYPQHGSTSSSRCLRQGGLTQRVAGILLALILTLGVLGACGASSTMNSAPTVSGAAPAATATGEATPGSCPTSNTKTFAKTKFVLHAGLAFGAFHRYLYKPLTAGSFSKGAHGRILTLIKAAAAVVFVEHEIRLSAGDVQANPTLCKLIASPLRSLAADVSGAVSQLRGGNTSGVLGAQSNLASITSLAKSHGATIVDQATPSLG